MARYHRETSEGKQLRFWGGAVALGSVAAAVLTYIGMANAAPRENAACAKAAASESCISASDQETAWEQLLEMSGAFALIGAGTFISANAVDRRLAGRRFIEHLDARYEGEGITDLEEFMDQLPGAPPDIVDLYRED